MPTKVNALIDYLSVLYGTEGYWDKGIDLNALPQAGPAPVKSSSKARAAVRETRVQPPAA